MVRDFDQTWYVVSATQVKLWRPFLSQDVHTKQTCPIKSCMECSLVLSHPLSLSLVLYYSILLSQMTQREDMKQTKDIKGANRQIDGHLVSSLHFILNSDKNILQHMTLGMCLPCKTICPVSTAQTNESCNAMYSLSLVMSNSNFSVLLVLHLMSGFCFSLLSFSWIPVFSCPECLFLDLFLHFLFTSFFITRSCQKNGNCSSCQP